MNQFFDEKSEQFSGTIDTAFGIPISSRYNRASEMAEMLLFCQEVARLGLQPALKNVNYDSNSNCCYFEFVRESIPESSPEADGILRSAKKTISQFDWFGTVCHKDGLEDPSEQY